MRRTAVVLILVVVVIAGAAVAEIQTARAAQVVNPTQWVAKQSTELLGRAPTPQEWQFWMAYYSSAGCSASTLATFGQAEAETSEFVSDYPESIDKASRVLALIRAVYNHEPTSSDWSTYYTPYTNGTMSWVQTVNAIYASSYFTSSVVPSICNTTSPDYHWGGGTALVIPASGSGPRTESQLQTDINNAAAAGGGTVLLDPNSVIPIGGSANGSAQLAIPAGVTVETAGLPGPTQYANMGRLVPAGRVCQNFVCGYLGIVSIAGGSPAQAGGALTSVWVDGNNTGESNPSPTFNWQLANVETTSGNGIQVTNDRLTDPPPNGAAVRADGYGTTGTGCTNEIISGNLITGYAGDHSMSQLGRGQWSDGISVSCEGASVSNNQLVDPTGLGITLRGDYNRAANATATQASQVTGNTVLSAGTSAFTAFGADQVGNCLGYTSDGLSTSGDTPAPCFDVAMQRPFTGASIANNTFWSGPRTFFHIGLMVGGEALWGDNAATIFGSGLSVTNNVVGVAGTQVNVGIAVGGMLNATLTGNSATTGSGGSYMLVNATPNIPDNPCAQVGVGQAQNVTSNGVQQSGATYSGTPQAVTTVNNDVPGPTAPPSLYGCLVPDAPPNGLEPITTGTSGSNQIFVGANSGNQFIPWGQNYGGPQPSNTDPNDTVPMLEDGLSSIGYWSEIVANFRQQKQMGSDVVRIHIDLAYVLGPPSQGFPNGTPIQASLNGLARLAALAEQNGLFLDVTGAQENRTARTSLNGQPCTGLITSTTGDQEDMPAWYDCLTTTTARWPVQAEFWSVVSQTLKSNPAVMVYDLANEPQVPTSAQSVWETGTAPPYYGQYLSEAALTTQNGRNSLATRWINQDTESIRDTGDTHMVTVGQLPGIAPADYGGFTPSGIASSSISYLSTHEYPTQGNAGTYDQDVNSFGVGKPVVVEETFDLYGDDGTESTFIFGSEPIATGWIGQWNQYTIAQDLTQDVYGFYEHWGELVMRIGFFISPLTTIQG